MGGQAEHTNNYGQQHERVVFTVFLSVFQGGDEMFGPETQV